MLEKAGKSLSKSINPELSHQINILKEMKLDTPRDLKHIKYEGHIKIPTIHNDYHSRATNHGYSRSESGGIFPKWSSFTFILDYCRAIDSFLFSFNYALQII